MHPGGLTGFITDSNEEAIMHRRPPYRLYELPMGKTKAYQEIHAGRLRAVKCGKLTLILPEDYDLYLKSLAPILPKSIGSGS
jgi:hypothetical protein